MGWIIEAMEVHVFEKGRPHMNGMLLVGDEVVMQVVHDRIVAKANALADLLRTIVGPDPDGDEGFTFLWPELTSDQVDLLSSVINDNESTT